MVTHPGSKRKTLQKPIKLSEILNQNKDLSKDDDEDDLKNWEEQIYGTDPKNKDTDGDGTKDGEELALGRDPKITGPNDKITPTQEKTADNKEKNLTRDFTDEFLKVPIVQVINKEKPTINRGAIGIYADQLLGHSVLSEAPKVKEEELKMAPVNSLTNIQNYLNDFDKIWERNVGSVEERELDIVVAAFQNQNFSQIEKINTNINAYQKVVDETKKLSAPASTWEFHKGVLNFLSQIKFSAELMKNAENDPLKTMLAIKERLELNKKLSLFLKDFQDKLALDLEHIVVEKKSK